VIVTVGKTEAELAELDVVALLRAGLAAERPGELFGDGAVAGAIRLDRAGVLPRSVSFLAEIVRRGGTRYAAGLPEPLPTAEQTDVIRPWLDAAAQTVTDPDADERFARWLAAVATILDVRRSTGGEPPVSSP
jgi:hypothetical protein